MATRGTFATKQRGTLITCTSLVHCVCMCPLFQIINFNFVSASTSNVAPVIIVVIVDVYVVSGGGIRTVLPQEGGEDGAVGS